jgi:hypothetical protein
MTQTAEQWAVETWGQVDLGDQRLNRRAVLIGAKMAANPEASLPQQMQEPAALQAAYRLMNNPHVHLNSLLEPVYQQTRQAADRPEVVLWVNDLTELDYTFHNAKTGLGPIGDSRGKGLLMHSTLAVQPEKRTVLGLGSVQVFLRQPAPKPRPKWTRSPEGKIWEKAAQQVGAAPEGCLWVHVSDAGSDYFPYLAACVDQGKHFLVRVSRNRLLTWEESDPQSEQSEAHKLMDYVRSLAPQAGSAYPVQVRATTKQAAREAEVAMTWAPVTLSPSAQAPPDERQHAPMQAWVLRVWEPNPPENVEAIEWILLSSLPLEDLSAARRCVDWYTCRWLCEDFHQCLKTGCKIERSQLDDRTDLENLLGFAAPIAVRLLQLRQVARHSPEMLANQVMEPLMVKVLALHQHIDAKTMTIRRFWLLVARLGGFQGRKCDGNPGWRTIWHGWRYLSDLTDGARLFAYTHER